MFCRQMSFGCSWTWYVRIVTNNPGFLLRNPEGLNPNQETDQTLKLTAPKLFKPEWVKVIVNLHLALRELKVFWRLCDLSINVWHSIWKNSQAHWDHVKIKTGWENKSVGDNAMEVVRYNCWNLSLTWLGDEVGNWRSHWWTGVCEEELDR